MAYQISDDCTACGACEAECPVSAISLATANMLSMLILALSAVLAKAFALFQLHMLNNFVYNLI